MSNRKSIRQACDGCKVRKIKCSEEPPCVGCTSAGIACTFARLPKQRGSRKLGKDTLAEIRKSQQQWKESGMRLNTADTPSKALEDGDLFEPKKVAALVLQLCVYRLRMYPVWPIIKIERLVAALQKTDPDPEVLALAYAVAAATIAQIKPHGSNQNEGMTAAMMEEQCQRVTRRRQPETAPNLTTVRIAFFLHVYYENQKPGSIKSIMYLREAITLSQVIGLHRESYYLDVEFQEQQIRRRTFWLLFITERGMSILHRLPVTLKVWAEFPNTQDSDDRNVLVAYQTLIELFWAFDKIGVFELMDQAGFETHCISSLETTKLEAIESLEKSLASKTISEELFNEVQAVDITVTIQWMRMILWRMSKCQKMSSVVPSQLDQNFKKPYAIARDLLSGLIKASDLSIEAHGPGLEIKIYQIICSVIEVANENESNVDENGPEYIAISADILQGLYRLLRNNEELQSAVRNQLSDLQAMILTSGSSSETSGYNRISDPIAPRKDYTPENTVTKTHSQLSAISPSSTGVTAKWQTPRPLDLTTESELGRFSSAALEQNTIMSGLYDQHDSAMMQYALGSWFDKSSQDNYLVVNDNSPINWV